MQEGLKALFAVEMARFCGNCGNAIRTALDLMQKAPLLWLSRLPGLFLNGRDFLKFKQLPVEQPAAGVVDGEHRCGVESLPVVGKLRHIAGHARLLSFTFD